MIIIIINAGCWYLQSDACDLCQPGMRNGKQTRVKNVIKISYAYYDWWCDAIHVRITVTHINLLLSDAEDDDADDKEKCLNVSFERQSTVWWLPCDAIFTGLQFSIKQRRNESIIIVYFYHATGWSYDYYLTFSVCSNDRTNKRRVSCSCSSSCTTVFIDWSWQSRGSTCSRHEGQSDRDIITINILNL